MKLKKIAVAAFLSLGLIFAGASVDSACGLGLCKQVQAAETGKCGDNLTWTVEGEVLTISGTGEMYSYNNTPQPWAKSSITTLVLEEGITAIGDCAFDYCSNFKGKLIIPESVTSIGWLAFDYCGFEGELIIPQGVTYIGGSAFEGCSGLDSIKVLSNSATIGDGVFKGVKLVKCFENSTTDQLTDLADENKQLMFTGKCGDNLTWVEDGEILTISGTGEMYPYNNTPQPWAKSSITTLVLEEGITAIGDCAFDYCSNFKGKLIIPESVTSIGWLAFDYCGFEGELIIPQGVTYIGGSAFEGCSGLDSIKVLSNSATIGDGVFKGVKLVKCFENSTTDQLNDLANENKQLIAHNTKLAVSIPKELGGKWIHQVGITVDGKDYELTNYYQNNNEYVFVADVYINSYISGSVGCEAYYIYNYSSEAAAITESNVLPSTQDDGTDSTQLYKETYSKSLSNFSLVDM